MATVSYRRATPGEYSAIVALNAANYITKLTPEERKEGFLSALFTESQVAAMAADLGITVAMVDGSVGGFLCAFRNEFEHGSPVVATMIASYDRLRFDGKPLRGYRSYVYGPVCIARELRRKGILRGLYDTQRKDLAGQFEIGVALVSRNNPHSLQAHVAGLGMVEAGDFEVSGNVFAVVVFRLPLSEKRSRRTSQNVGPA